MNNLEEFKCAECKKTFYKALTDEESKLRSEAVFGEMDISNCDIVCDDCFKIIMGGLV